jgi:hypothetical protein
MTTNAGGYGRFYTPDGTEASPPPNDGPAQPSSPYTIPGLQGGGGALQPDAVQNETLAEPSAARLQNAGLNKGGENSSQQFPLKEPDVQTTSVGTGGVPTDDDWRVRISLPPNSTNFYRGQNPDILTPILASGIDGVVFPYTPQISVTHTARYNEQALTHSNYKSYFYEGSEVSSIQITGEFTAQNEREAGYVLAAIMFFRACTKMFFGNDPQAGTPPVIVFLDGYGRYYFPHVSCVVTSFQHTMPADVDYIPFYGAAAAGNPQRIPTQSQLSVTLQPVVSRRKVHNEFTLEQYGRGLSTGYVVDKIRTGGFL